MTDDLVARLRAERAELRAHLAVKEALAHELNHAVANNRWLNEHLDELTAERDELRALLREALAHLKTGQWAVPTDITLMSRIDAALKEPQP